MAEPAGAGPVGEPEPLPLDQRDTAQQRKRGWAGLVGVAIFSAAFGGIAGLIGGYVAGLAVAFVVALPLVYIVVTNVRRRLWLEGTTLIVRVWRTRRIDLVHARGIDLVVTDLRGVRTIAMVVSAGQRSTTAKIDLAVYAGTGGRELDIVALRRLADALMGNTEANGLVFGQLLVAQLRSEARGDGAADRPLYRVASAAPAGKLSQRLPMEVVGRFVAGLG